MPARTITLLLLAPPLYTYEPERRQPKYIYPYPRLYNNTDKLVYPAFKGILKAKLRYNAATIGTKAE